jgi:thiol:disulfide interchange protein DsbC
MRTLLFALALSCCTHAHADFLKDLHAKYPQTKNASVKKAFGNFYSVVQGNEIVYINEDLSIMINGEVIDLKSNRSLTTSLREANRPKFKLADLNEADAIRMGSGNRRLFVFSDPDCPYCRQLQGELAKLQNVSIFVLPLPLTSLHPNAASVAESIWCASDRDAAWNGYLLRGAKPADKSCSNPLERNAALAAKYQVMGTPALVFEDGSVVPGMIPSSAIEARLSALAKK